jgi:hypothetical protein
MEEMLKPFESAQTAVSSEPVAFVTPLSIPLYYKEREIEFANKATAHRAV